jgi:hypothetical protein
LVRELFLLLPHRFILQVLIVVIECQADLIRDAIVSIRKQKLRSVEPKVEAQEKWKADLNEMIKYTLFQHTGEASQNKTKSPRAPASEKLTRAEDSWWNTSNVPGRKAENQNYVLGIPTYENTCRESINGWKGFEVVGPSEVVEEWKEIEIGGPQEVTVS